MADADADGLLEMDTFDPSKFSTLSIDIEEKTGIAVVQLDRPEQNNAVDDRMHSELCALFQVAERDEQVTALVLTGAGRVFSVGGDSSPDRPYVTHTGLSPIEEARLIIDGVIDLHVPFICAVNGHAIGLGATIASLADVSFAVPGARFGDPHVLAGLPAGNGSALIWPLLVGVNKAKQLLMTGEIMTSESAVSLGLLSEVVTEGEALDAALEPARVLVALPPQAVQGTKATIHLILRAAADLLMEFSLNAEQAAMDHPDFREALAAIHRSTD